MLNPDDLFHSLSNLEGKTDEQKQSIVPSGKAVEEIMTNLENSTMVIDDVAPSTILSNRIINSLGVIVTPSNNNSNRRIALYDVSRFVGNKINFIGYDNYSSSQYTWVVYSGQGYGEEAIVRLMSEVRYSPGSFSGEFIVETGDTYLAVTFYLGKGVPASATVTRNIKLSVEAKLANKQDILTLDNEPFLGSSLPVTSDGLYKAFRPLNTLIERKRGYILWGKQLETQVCWKVFKDYSAYIFDITGFVGHNVKVNISYHGNACEYKIVSDYSMIGYESTDISSVLLDSGANHSTVDNCISIDIPLTKASIVNQATVGKVYLIVNLLNFYEQKMLYYTDVLANRLDKLENATKKWVSMEKKRIINLVKSKLNHDIVIIGFNTDQHIRQSNKHIYTDPVIRGLNALRQMSDEIPFSLICLGGDAAGYTTENTQDKVDSDVLDVINAVDTEKCPVFYITGNHEGGQNLNWEKVNGISMYNLALKRNVVRRQIDGFRNNCTNCWYDDLGQKIRYIFLDPWARSRGTSNVSGKRYEDLEGLLCEALADSKLTDPQGLWSVVIFCHNVLALDVEGNSYDPVSKQDRNCWADFVLPRINNGVNIIACFNGHGHRDSHGVKNGVLFIETQAAQPTETSTTPSFNGLHHLKSLDSAIETSFDVFVIDKTDQKIYAFRYGAGTDRVFHYGTNPRIALCHLTGTITIDGMVASGTITASHHNTVYSSVLDENGCYNFPYLTPECEWILSYESYSESLLAIEGETIKNIII